MMQKNAILTILRKTLLPEAFGPKRTLTLPTCVELLNEVKINNIY